MAFNTLVHGTGIVGSAPKRRAAADAAIDLALADDKVAARFPVSRRAFDLMDYTDSLSGTGDGSVNLYTGGV